jgi:Uma2 family endonuclease
MAGQTAIPLAEYLRTTYEGTDREYVHGCIVERGMPPYKHGRIQKQLCAIFDALEKRWPLFAATEVRLQITSDVVRIPDFCVFEGQEPAADPVREIPQVVVEISSPDDRLSATLQKLEEYRAAGIPNIWFVDIDQRRLFVYRADGLFAVEQYELPEFQFTLTRADLELG